MLQWVCTWLSQDNGIPLVFCQFYHMKLFQWLFHGLVYVDKTAIFKSLPFKWCSSHFLETDAYLLCQSLHVNTLPVKMLLNSQSCTYPISIYRDLLWTWRCNVLKLSLLPPSPHPPPDTEVASSLFLAQVTSDWNLHWFLIVLWYALKYFWNDGIFGITHLLFRAVFAILWMALLFSNVYVNLYKSVLSRYLDMFFEAGLFSLLSSVRGNHDVLLQILSVRKGRKLIARLLPQLNHQQGNLVTDLVVLHLLTVLKKESTDLKKSTSDGVPQEEVR